MVKVAAVQMTPCATFEESLEKVKAYIAEAKHNCPDLDVITFPEYCYYAPVGAEDAKAHAVDVPGPFTDALAECAVKYNVNIISGSFAERTESGKILNSMVFINREGKILDKYRAMKCLGQHRNQRPVAR